MLLLTCPICSITADETEFACGGQYTIGAPRGGYARGVVREWWLCEMGCGTWFGVARHTANQRIAAIWTAGAEPPTFAEEAP